MWLFRVEFDDIRARLPILIMKYPACPTAYSTKFDLDKSLEKLTLKISEDKFRDNQFGFINGILLAAISHCAGMKLITITQRES